MSAYILRRLMLLIPTLLGIEVINFFVIRAGPGGPAEPARGRLRGRGDVTSRSTGSGDANAGAEQARQADEGSMSRAGRGLPPELIEPIRKQYGFDKPMGERFLLMMRDYLVFDLGES